MYYIYTYLYISIYLYIYMSGTPDEHIQHVSNTPPGFLLSPLTSPAKTETSRHSDGCARDAPMDSNQKKGWKPIVINGDFVVINGD